MRLLPYGDRAVLVEVDDPGAVLALGAALGGVAGVVEVVPARRTLLVRFDPRLATVAALAGAMAAHAGEPPPRPPGDPVELTVRYDGPDLDGVADEVGISPQEVVRRHVAADYTVAFCGFTPGFAYLTGLDPSLQVARRSEPRLTVPSGSVGLAGEFTGVYPRSSPGGWRLIGRTDAVLWDTARTPPALLAPGTPVRFRPA